MGAVIPDLWIAGLATIIMVVTLVLAVVLRNRLAQARWQFAACFASVPAGPDRPRCGADATLDAGEPEVAERLPKRYRRWPFNV